MFRVAILAVNCIAFLIPFSALAQDSCDHTDNSFHCVEYVGNYDADTITFNIHSLHPFFGKNAQIRVEGIDTPELRTKNECEKKLSYKARNFVAEQLETARTIDLVNASRGKYFRIVANVKVNGRYLGRMLLRNGYAVPYDGGTKQKVDWCAMLDLVE